MSQSAVCDKGDVGTLAKEVCLAKFELVTLRKQIRHTYARQTQETGAVVGRGPLNRSGCFDAVTRRNDRKIRQNTRQAKSSIE